MLDSGIFVLIVLFYHVLLLKILTWKPFCCQKHKMQCPKFLCVKIKDKYMIIIQGQYMHLSIQIFTPNHGIWNSLLWKCCYQSERTLSVRSPDTPSGHLAWKVVSCPWLIPGNERKLLFSNGDYYFLMKISKIFIGQVIQHTRKLC